jgi:hypothetical protein
MFRYLYLRQPERVACLLCNFESIHKGFLRAFKAQAINLPSNNTHYTTLLSYGTCIWPVMLKAPQNMTSFCLCKLSKRYNYRTAGPCMSFYILGEDVSETRTVSFFSSELS